MYETAFLDAAHNRLHLIHHRPAGAARGHVLCVPPFGEEMNRARRMLALQARALAQAGWHAWLPDLSGCGDSGGDLEAVGSDTWLADLDACAAHARARAGDLPLSLLGVRLGGALACTWLRARGVDVASLVLWQPLDGAAQIEQLLRVRAAASLFSGKRERVETLRAALREGAGLEIAGYRLSPALLDALEALDLNPPAAQAAPRAHWFELAARGDARLSDAAVAAADAWAAAGSGLQPRLLTGVAFWATAEIAVEPALIDATLAALDGASCDATGGAQAAHG